MNSYSLKSLTNYFLKLGAFRFGGPVALCADMQKNLVERLKVFTQQEYDDGFALSQLAPGPVATKLAMYLGWLRGGIAGATLAGFAIIAPSFLMVIAIAEFYERYGTMAWSQSIFYGLGAAVLAILIQSAWRLGESSLRGSKILISLALLNGIYAVVNGSPSTLLFIASGLVMVLPFARLSLMNPFLLTWMIETNGAWAVSLNVFFEFVKAGALVFGSGLTIVPLLHGPVVEQLHWLNERQFLDAVAVALITPGPAVITVAFIGYLVSGMAGAVAASLGVFLPIYLFVILVAPFYQRLLKSEGVRTFIKGVTAAAVGAISGMVILIAKSTLADLTSLIIFLATGFAMFQFKKIPEPVWLLIAGAVGLLVR